MTRVAWLCATVLAGLGVLYSMLAGRGDDGIERDGGREQRGYYLLDARLTEIGANGRPRVEIRARQIEQQLDEQSVELEQLTLDYASESSGAWTVTAQRGHMALDRETIALSGDVILRGGEPRGSAVVRTERLDYDTRANHVSTAEPVAIEFGAHRLGARGLQADLNSGNLQLESDISGRFEP